MRNYDLKLSENAEMRSLSQKLKFELQGAITYTGRIFTLFYFVNVLNCVAKDLITFKRDPSLLDTSSYK